MNKSKKLKIAAMVIIIIVLVSSIIFYISLEHKSIEGSVQTSSKENKSIDKKENYKNYEAYLEDNVNSYLDMFTMLVNNKKSDLTYIKDILVKSSEAEKKTDEYIRKFRNDFTQIDDRVYVIKEIKENADEKFDVSTEVTFTVKNNKLKYKIDFIIMNGKVNGISDINFKKL